MELVTKLDVILMLIGIVTGITAETLDKNNTSPSPISSVEPSAQNTTPTETTMTTPKNEQNTTTQGDMLPNTTFRVESSTQDTTMTQITMTTQDTTMIETTITTPGKGQESKMCDYVFIFGGVAVALTIPITVLITILLIWRRIGSGPLIRCTRSDAHYSSVECNVFVMWARFTRSIRRCCQFLILSVCCCQKSIGTGPRKEDLTGSDQIPRIVPDRNGAEQRNTVDEPDYDQPQWNRIALSDHRQPIGNEMENTEYENLGYF